MVKHGSEKNASSLILGRWLAKCDRMVKIINLFMDLFGPNGIYFKVQKERGSLLILFNVSLFYVTLSVFESWLHSNIPYVW